MTTTVIRKGEHKCTLPPVWDNGFTKGAVILCDECGALWRFSAHGAWWDLWVWLPRWVSVGPVGRWWLRRGGWLDGSQCTACRGTGRVK